jgi:hypothetical protein
MTQRPPTRRPQLEEARRQRAGNGEGRNGPDQRCLDRVLQSARSTASKNGSTALQMPAPATLLSRIGKLLVAPSLPETDEHSRLLGLRNGSAGRQVLAPLERDPGFNFSRVAVLDEPSGPFDRRAIWRTARHLRPCPVFLREVAHASSFRHLGGYSSVVTNRRVESPYRGGGRARTGQRRLTQHGSSPGAWGQSRKSPKREAAYVAELSADFRSFKNCW